MLSNLNFLDGVSEDYLQKVNSFIDEWQSDSATIQVQTSGSTGAPKTIVLEKNAVRESALATGSFFGLLPDQNALLNLSPDHIAGKLMIVRAYEHQMSLTVAPLVSNPLEFLVDHNIHFAAFVPSQIEIILKNYESKLTLNSIENVIIGGAPLSPNLENELTQLSNNIYATFGMTETITHFALRKLGTPIYRCLAGFKISVDKRSCLVVQPNAIVENLLVTNDVIDLIDDMTFKWRGRIDNVINSGGIKIHPEKVEKMIAHLLPENRFYVASKKDETYGEIAVLVVEGFIESDDILLNAKESLPKHHEPKEIVIEDIFEETKTHKIIRKKF